ncbi:nuclear transport factor 2 family protein [Microbaculum marinum]|uniref:Nuclear transport factor 2 family protein n=1 Tax=Microbaculum marinum TaxID=1764581 RepID=A0AAW9RJX2_9HYPH
MAERYDDAKGTDGIPMSAEIQMIPETEDEITTLFEEYAAGFDDFDAEAVADCFAYPCTIWQLGAGNVFLDREELLENIEALLAVYDTEEIVHSTFEVKSLVAAGATAFANLSWRQEREDGEAAMEFACRYALIDGHEGWRIATVFNEDEADGDEGAGSSG